ncbi:hypothetical protein ACJ72_06224 [Emergomyces africanus]|uniref:Uncharacterized protein n=1 Tax=Emergomyces africanus TaxID=1955775 RepID=A0A1B7NS13_9EURO|nr:hypothetical protein ACJ72_06224 [Emergomyces africanus]
MEKTTARRALGPKSTNIKQRSSSPTKKNTSAGGWEKEVPKPNPKPPKNRNRDAIDKSIQAVPTPAIKQKKPDVVEINLLPEQLPVEENKAAAPGPFFGNSYRHQRRHTTSSVWDEPSIPPVPWFYSYAEPNLRDKMRRPTKELVDAVSGDARFRRSSKSDLDMAKERYIDANSHDFDISSMAYNDSSGSTLGAKDENMELSSNVMTDKKRQTLPANKFDYVSAPETRQSTSSVAISTLMAGSKRRSHRERDISENSADYEQNNIPGNSSTRSSRRHSSNPATIGASSRSRRNQSSNNIFSKEAAADVQAALETAGIKTSSKRYDDDHQRASSASSNPRAAKPASEFDYDAFLDAQQGVSEAKRVQRLAASRRRSMML